MALEKQQSVGAAVSGVASYGALGHVPPPRLPTISFLVYLGVYLTANYPSIVRVVCKISWCRCQQLIALSINTALVTCLFAISYGE